MKAMQRILLAVLFLTAVLPMGIAIAEDQAVTPTTEEVQLEPGFSTVLYEGDYDLDAYLAQGGASSDAQVVEFLMRHLMGGGAEGLSFVETAFGCSVLSVTNAQGEALFGRNFDWQACDALVVQSVPENGYASIATVNMSFLDGFSGMLNMLPPQVRTIAALYAPLDGMNDQGLCVAVNMIQDSAVINQETDKPDITTTTVIRMLLDKAASVEEAVALLEQYDMHSSMGMMVHLAIADAAGNSVVIEYVNNEMVIIESPVVTNFYLAEGDKNGIGTAQSHTRYDMLVERMAQNPTMEMEDVRDALDSVSKRNFGEFESTEWSIVFNQHSGEVRYYHREDYTKGYTFQLEIVSE